MEGKNNLCGKFDHFKDCYRVYRNKSECMVEISHWTFQNKDNT